MKNYIVMLSRDSLSGDYDIRCRSDVDTHPQFKRSGDFVTYRKTDGTKTIYTIVFEGEESVCKKFKENLQQTYAVAIDEVLGSLL